MVRRSAKSDKEVEASGAGLEEMGEGNPPQGDGAIGGMVGGAADQREVLRDELGPFLREIIRDEVRSLLDVHPLGEGEFPLGRGAVPRRPRAMEEEQLRDGASHSNGYGAHSSSGGMERSLSPPRLSPAGSLAGPADGVQNPPVKEDLSVKITPFNPKEVDWYAFKANFNTLAGQAAWTERTKTTKLMAALQVSLPGVAADLPQPVKFKDLITRVDDIYGLGNTQEDASLKLQMCKMEQGETVALYAERVRQLVSRAYPDYTMRDREQQALRAFLQGLPTRNEMRMQMRMKGFTSLREATEFGSRLEQILKDEKSSEPRKQHLRSATQEQNEILDAVAQVSRSINQLNQQQNRQSQDHGNPQYSDRRPGPAMTNGHGAPRPSGGGQGDRRAGTPKRTPQTHPCYVCGDLGHWLRECPLFVALVENLPADNPLRRRHLSKPTGSGN